ncbi:hypothetical protein SeF6a_212 [Salmonella phage SeF6a]|nr:hypothetical protein SeF6a_212 [Salmonella phage SeF6a]
MADVLERGPARSGRPNTVSVAASCVQTRRHWSPFKRADEMLNRV